MVSSVWTRERPRAGLSQDRIVAAAVELLDADGLEALSMRTLAARLDTKATSLYRHVANKDELIELVVDEVYGEMEVVASGPWRSSVADAARSLRAMVLRHPWVASVLGQVGLAELGPNLSDRSARLLALFTDGGFPGEEADLAMKTVLGYVVGMTVSEAAYVQLLARTGQDEEELTAHGVTSKALRDKTFEYGLERVLKGLGD
ncbi:TetR/AcrR family transcriptional regulator [Lentzea sp. NEAU-D13]|uniref:TetR/AcrR family transcriptional regulator n=1 Tax=Lentzea alba TaxID=2714351 RepID=A0A7C9VRT3_9PSEU|nr:TetR/AcrR family transcriptional regulator [Lentzea alba]NGY57598.1 TetR/AcrR family transcriptional regulator [Lentzea alba]